MRVIDVTYIVNTKIRVPDNCSEDLILEESFVDVRVPEGCICLPIETEKKINNG
jgi:hypothetical protein